MDFIWPKKGEGESEMSQNSSSSKCPKKMSHELKEDTNRFGSSRPIIILAPSEGRNKGADSTVIFFRGLGDTGRGFLDICEKWSKTMPNTRFILPTAPMRKVSLNAGMPQNAWFDINFGEGGNMFAVLQKYPDGIEESWQNVLSLIQTEVTEHKIPPSRIVLAGFSMGAYLATWAGLQFPKSLAGVVMMSGMLFGANHMRNVTDARFKVPFLVCHGKNDLLIPPMAAEMAVNSLKDVYGVKVKFHSYPIGHEVCDEEMDIVLAFLKEVLPSDIKEEEIEKELRECDKEKSFERRLPSETKVIIRNLKSRPEQNGKVGKIVQYLPEKDRYLVRIPDSDIDLSLKIDNMIQNLSVKVENETKQIVGERDGKYVFDCGSEMEFERVLLPIEGGEGRSYFARVRDLVSESGQVHNGRLGRISMWDKEKGRYQLDLGCDVHLSLKPANLQV